MQLFFKQIYGVVVFLTASFLFVSCSGNRPDSKTQEPSATAPADHVQYIPGKYICTCGGCPEVMEDNPGACPKCGMPLEKYEEKTTATDTAASQAAPEETFYVCPMKCTEDKFDKPGKCTMCGMELKAVHE